MIRVFGPTLDDGEPPDPRVRPVLALLDTAYPPVPPDLAERAAVRGDRLLRRRHTALALTWTVLSVAVVLFLVWAAATRPWQLPPDTLSPPDLDW
ncbi:MULTISPECIES: hypothetical protein [unclassified Streptomyces]|uniref:hypothetical protein n=1 Tax=unclassified Streptomyces TaxID=2593676 RepID=UPI0022B6D82F|nr:MULTISPECIES: hypothetical protein [unclassified Streptomyces]MCZ7416858.1 hypothetical protein [Streptomyces sp. WMMC897]MCZ7433325.1 hypothetical protein [Streptomyces sp. WMMC1477]